MAPAAPATAPRRESARPAKRQRPATRAGANGSAAPKRSATKSSAAPKRSTAATSAPASRAERNSRAIAGARAVQRAGAAPATRTAPARRKSGPAARPARARPAAAPRPVTRVIQSAGMPLLDRLLRGRAWVAIVGVLLAGIVFLNVSLLELNRGIAQTDAQSAALERANSSLRERVATLDSGERIRQLAAARGFVMPQPGDVTYLRPHPRIDARLAAVRMKPPAPVTSLTGSTTPTTGTTAATATATTTGTTTYTPTAGTTAPTATTTSSTSTSTPGP
jgi:cell division protein FtsB